MTCCICNGSCNHVGPHSYCATHGGVNVPAMTTTTSGTVNLYYTPEYVNNLHARLVDAELEVRRLKRKNRKLRRAVSTTGENE